MNNRQKIANIRTLLLSKQITYEQALALCNPIIKEMNEKAAVIAKKYNKRPPNFKASKLLR